MRHSFCLTSLIAFALATTGAAPLFGQSEATEGKPPPSGCIFDVSQFDRTPRTSPELIRLESELIDPRVPVSQTLILELGTQAGRDLSSAPQASNTGKKGYAHGAKNRPRQEDFSGKYLDILARALSAKKGEALIDSLLTLTEDQFLRTRPMQPPGRQCLQEAVAKTLPAVPLQVQSRILFSEEYPLFKSAALALYLHQLYESIEDNIVPDEYDPPFDRERIVRAYRTRILKRIYEADPDTGRGIILEEIASKLPRSDIEALRLLPDETLPEMDSTFASQLAAVYENSDWAEYNVKLGVIERYATAAALPAVKAIYLNDPDDRNQYHDVLFFSYFLRTDPGFGKQLIEKSLGMPQSNCSTTLFTELAAIRLQPELREIARRHLDDPDKCIAADAAYSFKYMGSQDVEAFLWRGLEAWHKEWATKSEPAPFSEQQYEDSLVEALLFGRGPCTSRDTLERLKHLYIKGSSVDGNITLSEWHDPVRIVVQPQIVESPAFSVDFCSGPLSAEQLQAALPDFPAGTEFEWYGPADPLLQSLLEAVRLNVEGIVKQNAMSFRVHTAN